MSARGTIADDAAMLRDHEDRLRRIERGADRAGVTSFGAVRVGGFVIEVEPGGDLQARRLSDNATTLLMAG